MGVMYGVRTAIHIRTVQQQSCRIWGGETRVESTAGENFNNPDAKRISDESRISMEPVSDTGK